MCCRTEAGSYLRLIDSCITQLKAQGPSRNCNESKEEEGMLQARAGPSERTSASACERVECEGGRRSLAGSFVCDGTDSFALYLLLWCLGVCTNKTKLGGSQRTDRAELLLE